MDDDTAQTRPRPTHAAEEPRTTRPAELVRALFAGVNAGDLDVLDRVVAVDYRQHGSGIPQGRAGLAGYFTALRLGFPDLAFDVTELVGDEHRVACLVHSSGTHRGPAFGLAATGRRVSTTTVEVFGASGGRLVEHWATVDTADVLRQLRGEPAEVPSAG